MALRGSSVRRSTASPLTSVLRDLDRRTRPQGRRGPTGPEGAAGADGVPGPPGAPGPAGPGPVAGIVLTGADGRAAWTYPAAPFSTAPVLAALVHDAAPDGSTTLTVVLESVTPEQAVVRVWRTRPLLGLGLLPAVPAGAGVAVHLHAAELAPGQLPS